MERSILLAMATLALLSGTLVMSGTLASFKGARWSEEEKGLIASLSLDSLPPLARDPSNRVADDPRAARLGETLFHDTGLSGNGKVACATCHLKEKQFQDGMPLGHGVGTTNRRTMPIAGTAYQPFLFWDGRKDSQWSQALGPLESPVEHGTDRMAVARHIGAVYRKQYEAIFGPLPDFTDLPDHAAPAGPERTKAAWQALTAQQRDAVNQVFANTGKAIAAYERGIMPGLSRFDRYAKAVIEGRSTARTLDERQVRGLAIFIGKGSCTNCHSGPLLSDGHFHNTGVAVVPGLPDDRGRSSGVEQVKIDEFNCLGPYSDAKPDECGELNFMAEGGEDQVRAFKPPSLRNVATRAPFMHAGQFRNLDAVLDHYNRAPAAPAGHSELKPLSLSPAELTDLKAFLESLSEGG